MLSKRGFTPPLWPRDRSSHRTIGEDHWILCTKGAGFTLIELMIVVAIIAIIAAIAIPGLLRSTLSSNEKSAMGTMREMINQMAQWKQGDRDRNGINDYWVLDMSCMYRIESAVPGVPVSYLNLDVARADGDMYMPGGAPVYVAGPPAVNILQGTGAGGVLGVTGPVPKAGYLYEAMLNAPNGTAYAVINGPELFAATNMQSFGFQAIPSYYNVSGMNVFMIDERGVVWKADTGAGYVTPPVALNPSHPGLPPPSPPWGTID